MFGATHCYEYDYYPVNYFTILDEYKDVVS